MQSVDASLASAGAQTLLFKTFIKDATLEILKYSTAQKLPPLVLFLTRRDSHLPRTIEVYILE